MFNVEIMQHFLNPENAGMLTGADGVGQFGNVRSGDVMKIYLRIEKGIITDARFKTFGGVTAIAVSDVVCNLVKGKTVDAAMQITDKDMLKELPNLDEGNLPYLGFAREMVVAAVQDYYKNLEKEKNKKK